MKILITGGTGMVGRAFTEVETSHELVFVGSKRFDLRNATETERMFEQVAPDAVIHLAAKVGGVRGNLHAAADYYADNIKINTNVLHTAMAHKTPKVLSLLSTCIYPDQVTYPLTEDQIHSGEPHPSNFGYSYAKRMTEVYSRALRKQHGLNYITAVPNNLYGPHDNFDLINGHVIPAVIRKIWEAKLSGVPPVFWGSGTPLREFTYAGDIAKILLFVLENYDSATPLNIGNPGEVSIRQIIELISELLEYEGEILWDSTQPDGQYRKPSCNRKLLELGWKNEFYTRLPEGLTHTCNWFIEHYPRVRGI